MLVVRTDAQDREYGTAHEHEHVNGNGNGKFVPSDLDGEVDGHVPSHALAADLTDEHDGPSASESLAQELEADMVELGLDSPDGDGHGHALARAPVPHRSEALSSELSAQTAATGKGKKFGGGVRKFFGFGKGNKTKDTLERLRQGAELESDVA